MLKIKINKEKNIEYKEENGILLLNGKRFLFDIVPSGRNTFSILKDNKSYNAELISFDQSLKILRLKINGVTVEAEVKDQLDLLLEQMGLEGKEGNKVQDLKAPMPGLIMDIMVKEGEEVENGTPLLILEAMKMENIIKSTGKGVIKLIKVNKGQSVEKNQVLIQF
jgi:biotin carboxyl carrier protein